MQQNEVSELMDVIRTSNDIDASALNGKRGSIDEVDRFGRTALFYAVGYGKELIVRTLVNAGADPYRKDLYGVSPWSLAHHLRRRKRVIEALSRTSTVIITPH